MKISIEKSPIPVLFIDTSFINKICKRPFERKSQILFSYLRKKVTAGEIVCPMGGQDQEVDDKSAEIFELYSLISLNIEFRDKYQIEQHQLLQMLKLIKSKTDILKMSYKDAFSYNLIDEIARRKSMKVLWPYSHNPSDDEKNKRSITKNDWTTALNKLHEAGLTKKEEYLDALFLCHYDAAENIIYRLYKDETGTSNMTTYLATVGDSFSKFKRVLGSNSLIDYLEFLRSQSFRRIPYIEISSKIYSDILFSNKISYCKSGDKNDVEYISHFLPYCNLMLIDSSQCQRVRSLKLDKKYMCNVFSESKIPYESIDDLDNYL